MKQNDAKFLETIKDTWKITALSNISSDHAVSTSVLR